MVFLLNKKTQSSVELIVILGISVTLISVLSILSYNYLTEGLERTTIRQITNSGNKIVQEIENKYYQSVGSFKKIEINLPNNVVNLTIEKVQDKDIYYLLFNYTEQGEHEVQTFFTENQNIVIGCKNCTEEEDRKYFNEENFGGLHILKILREEDKVSMEFVKQIN